MGSSANLCVGEDFGWDDFVGAEGLSRVHEGGENLGSLLAFACGRSAERVVRAALRWAGRTAKRRGDKVVDAERHLVRVVSSAPREFLASTSWVRRKEYDCSCRLT